MEGSHMSTEVSETNDTTPGSEVTTAKPPKKKGKAGKVAAGILLGGCLLGSLGLNIYQACAQQQYSSRMVGFIDEQRDRWAEEEKQENEYIEDGYKVGGEYEIRSTTHISDAYQSGDDSQLSEEDKQTLSMASDVLDQVIEDGMGDYEKELAVYRWMVTNIGHGSGGVISRPGTDRSPFTPHDVLSSKNAVCVGYATTFRLFMNMLGLDCHIVHNDYHSWDLVQLDGDWYHVDIYSDAHNTLFSNFNMTDQLCRGGHDWDESALPAADSVKYSPAVQNGVEVDDLYAVPAAMKEALEEGGSDALYFKFKTPLTKEDLGAAEFLVSRLQSVVVDGMHGGEETYYYMQACWYPDEQGNDILGFLLEREGGEEDEPDAFDPSSPEGKKLIQAIAEAFGLDPAALGGEPERDVPVEDIIVGGSVSVDANA